MTPNDDPFRAWLAMHGGAKTRILASSLGLSAATVRYWRAGGTVAVPHHDRVKAEALKDGVTLTTDDLLRRGTR